MNNEKEMEEAFENWKSKNLFIDESGEVYTKSLKMGKERGVLVSIDTFQKCWEDACLFQQEKIAKLEARW